MLTVRRELSPRFIGARTAPRAVRRVIPREVARPGRHRDGHRARGGGRKRPPETRRDRTGGSAVAPCGARRAAVRAYRRWSERDLSGADYVYCWAYGLHFGVRLDADRVCTLVVVGARRWQEEAGRPLLTGTVTPPSRGRACCGTPAAGGCGPQRWRSGTGRRGFWA